MADASVLIVEDEEEHIQVFTREQLATVLDLVHPRHRLFFRLLAGPIPSRSTKR